MSWILDRGWFPWVQGGWLIILVTVVPVLYGLDALSNRLWRTHPRFRQWIARNLGA